MDAEFDTRLGRLDDALLAVVQLLEAHGQAHWATWFARCRERLSNRDGGAFDEILGAFGGMGSISDVILSQQQGANARLEELREVIWTEARFLRAALRAE